ncbi:hypothetical protein KSP40_PGU008434 [Platanthera guangdongensis]|uniref:Uncharacterized protein n=1 Tax=Platanthera guangdongensis TaxID=2320717 RepID=A0ABR2M7W0_9ASPA
MFMLPSFPVNPCPVAAAARGDIVEVASRISVKGRDTGLTYFMFLRSKHPVWPSSLDGTTSMLPLAEVFIGVTLNPRWIIEFLPDPNLTQ